MSAPSSWQSSFTNNTHSTSADVSHPSHFSKHRVNRSNQFTPTSFSLPSHRLSHSSNQPGTFSLGGLLSGRRRKYVLLVLLAGGMMFLWQTKGVHEKLGAAVGGEGASEAWSSWFGPSREDQAAQSASVDTKHSDLATKLLPISPLPPTTPASTPPPDRHPVSNGLLHVDLSMPLSKHPIHQLIEDAKAEWDVKVKRQSKTLGDAVEEYKRRNGGKRPPKGFDKWWAYVQEHKVPLVDEYDLIMRDLKPFQAYAPHVLREEVKAMTSWADTYVLSVRGGKADASRRNFDQTKIEGSGDRVEGQLGLIKDVAKWIPDFDAIFNIHDTPVSFVSASHKTELAELVADGEFYDPEEEADRSFSTWGAACPPSTPLHTLHPNLGTDPTSLLPDLAALAAPFQPPSNLVSASQKTFIASHTHNMDLCHHPEIIGLHGMTSGTKPQPQAQLRPVFSLSRTGLHSDVLVIPTEQWGEKTEEEIIKWESKKDNNLLWRGRNTGAFYSKETPWRTFHRSRLAAMASSTIEQAVSVLSAPLANRKDTSDGATLGDKIFSMPEGKLNDKYLDVGLAYEPTQCSIEDGTCAEIAKELTFRPVRTFEEENMYRYILDVDGNSWSARFKRLLSTGSVILKSTIFPEWWNDRIQPWVHYIPVQVDYSDLYDIMAFFRGDEVAGHQGQEQLAKEIALAGRQWSLSSWRKEDMTAYMFRLYLEWARLYAHDRDSMDYIHPTTPSP